MAPATQRIEQNLLDTRIGPLEVISILETDLTDEKISSLLVGKPPTDADDVPDVVGPIDIGIAGGYTASGTLSTLAVCVLSTIFLIQFRSKTKATNEAVTASRKLLQDSILCRPDVSLFAFDLAPLALALYYDHGLLLESGVDVQSGCTCEDPRNYVEAIQFATASTQVTKIYHDNIRNAFASKVRDVEKPETSRTLALRSWLAGYLPTLGDMKERLGEVPKINTKSMPADVSICFRAICQSY
jgi:hypothetical protein